MTIMVYHMISCVQDTIVVVPLFPYCIEEKPGASVRPSQNGFARRLQPDSK